MARPVRVTAPGHWMEKRLVMETDANRRDGQFLGSVHLFCIPLSAILIKKDVEYRGNEMNSRTLLKINLEKNWRGYEVYLLLIAALEGMMILYGLYHFDFRETRRILYFSAYLALFAGSLAALAVDRLSMTRKLHKNLSLGNAVLYSTLLILWSAMISALDICGGGYAVTYMTILAAVGSTIALPPGLYASLALLSTVGMTAAVQWLGKVHLETPFYLNHGIFLLVIILVQMRSYRSLKEQYRMESQLLELANKDALTGVGNRRMLDERVKQLLAEQQGFTFALMDVDDFKTINDRHGHAEGDRSLIRIADTLMQLFGAEVFRYGGDEFAVIAFAPPEVTARKIDALNARLKRTGGAYLLKTCAGVYWVEPGNDTNLVFERADSALYQAKQTGKGRAVIYQAPKDAL